MLTGTIRKEHKNEIQETEKKEQKHISGHMLHSGFTSEASLLQLSACENGGQYSFLLYSEMFAQGHGRCGEAQMNNTYMNKEIRVDPEFESKIPPLTGEEYRLLEESILAEGAVIYPLITWNGVLVDGHNRYRIVTKHPHIRYTIYEKTFADRHEALAWICKNQLGRRNLSAEQKKYLIGKQYEAEKASHGGLVNQCRDKSGRFTTSGQNDHTWSSAKTSKRIAKENNTSERFVRRAEHFAKGVDIAEEASPGIRQEILSGAVKPTDTEIMALARASPEDRPAMAEQLRIPKEDKKPDRRSEKKRALKISDDMLRVRGDGGEEAMLFELSDALDSMIFRWTMCIKGYSKYFARKGCRRQISALIQEGFEFLRQIEGGNVPE